MKYVFTDINEAVDHEPKVSDRHKWRCYECKLDGYKCWVWERSPSWALGRAAAHWGANADAIRTNVSADNIVAAFQALTLEEQQEALRKLGKMRASG